MRILLTNDDGYDAQGLSILYDCVKTITDDVWVVAPKVNHSGAAHAMTLSQPLRAQQYADQCYSVTGTPTDCVIMAVREIMDVRPDWVISGINEGQNVADHITYSGTVAGAMEGALLGIPSIALSQTHDWSLDTPIDWTTSVEHTSSVLKKLMTVPQPRTSFLNVNFPIVCQDQSGPEFVITKQADRLHNMYIDQRFDTGQKPYYWLKFGDFTENVDDDTDLAAIHNGKISVTPISIDLTDYNYLKKLEISGL